MSATFSICSLLFPSPYSNAKYRVNMVIAKMDMKIYVVMEMNVAGNVYEYNLSDLFKTKSPRGIIARGLMY